MGWLRKKYEESKKGFIEDWEEKKKANAETRKASREAYFKERQQQQINLARARARYERAAAERQLKARYIPPKIKAKAQSLSGGFGSNSFMSWKPSSLTASSYFAPSKPATTPNKIKRHKKKRKAIRSKHIIIGGKAYPLG